MLSRKERYSNVLAWFAANMHNAKSELNFRNPYELLVAVMLSAQCTDKRVNQVTPALFDRYPDVFSLAKGSEEEILKYINSVSYPNAKAQHLLQMAQIVAEKCDGIIPSTMEALTSLPGVGRKTANVMLAVAFGKPAMPVDTHVFRVSHRVGLAEEAKNPLQTEMILRQYIPEEILSDAHHWLLLHGRYVCTAIGPKCDECGIREYCKEFKE